MRIGALCAQVPSFFDALLSAKVIGQLSQSLNLCPYRLPELQPLPRFWWLPEDDAFRCPREYHITGLQGPDRGQIRDDRAARKDHVRSGGILTEIVIPPQPYGQTIRVRYVVCRHQ